MQRTRLYTLIDITNRQLGTLFSNPWRRIALNLISLLMGFFMGSAIATTAGQDAVWDVPAAGFLLIFTEITSRLVYYRRNPALSPKPVRRSLIIEILNLFKIGLTYSLFVEAFKLGS
ncbi:DUF565 domain-containing protein [Myxosarcina sp. GI1]|uniref:DUF565 domain-containing protein n=1 Tax=Myxosarcina sp. GI1 TaxID=1541065 RepID=UPI00056500CF|nr:DUF565 domain-containing protein [Myxosarcina sp. GI1]